jgi:hypothetical protein
MSNIQYPRLQTLICEAGLNAAILHRLLNGQRRQVATAFGLSGQELEAVMALQANTYQDLAQGLRDWMARQEQQTGQIGLTTFDN